VGASSEDGRVCFSCKYVAGETVGPE